MTEEVIQVRDQFYIRSTSARMDDRMRVLKQGDTFVAFDRFGDIDTLGRLELGMYHQDTRFLSRLGLRIEGVRPLLLSSTVRQDNAILTVDLTNPDLQRDGEVVVPHGTVHIFRSAILWEGTCHGRLRLHNFGDSTVQFSFDLDFDADFSDLFEVRGMTRKRRGQRFPVEADGDGAWFRYEGLDGRIRATRVSFDPAPGRLVGARAHYDVSIGPGEFASYHFAICCEPAAAEARLPSCSFEQAYDQATAALDDARADEPHIYTSNEQFNGWLNRSIADLHMMLTDTPHGPYPYAGVPWYSTAFGRDGLITALQCLWYNPGIARGVLQYLAHMQADAENAEQDAEPGKILHETRNGEMAALGEVPFGRYYGSIDSTPLFVVLAGAYFERTGDLAFIESLWPHVERALGWIERYGDVDGDGFIEYARKSDAGLVNQGWKDSNDAVFHADGTQAEGPIALCEVQGYVYGAYRAAAMLARCLGDHGREETLTARAAQLRQRFEASFWSEELSTYVIALDGQKRPCAVRTSNAGHCLYSGIVSQERAARVAATLTGHESFSGWGVRTVAEGEAAFNPMSYHNGSIWPHDNALVAAGFARYGCKKEAAQVMGGLFDASLFFEGHRLPELFCGFPRRFAESPTQYPVSCSPQTWASGAVLLLLQGCLGLELRALQREIVFSNPYLPEFLREVRISGLRVGDASVDLSLVRHKADVGINVLRREGRVSVVSVK
jgi:glycogen debranching enzyme